LTNDTPERAQRFWSRIAGAILIALIALFMAADFAARDIAGTGGYTAIATRVAAALPLYRAVLAVNVIGAALTIVLAAALYCTLKPAAPDLARLALFFRLAEGFLEGVTCACGFAIARAYASPFASFGADEMQGLISLLRAFQGGMFHIITLFFGIGSVLFFWIFVTSRAIPRVLSVFGLLASLIVPVLALTGLILPETAKLLQPGWYPIMVAELTTGAWLLIFAIRTVPLAKE
jgi:hypothetical protein